ncbi:MAG TPA: recombinase [Bacteroidales bacterium]|nr:recombinase [Bacteroidales bacterium]
MIQRFLDYIAIERRLSPLTVTTYSNDLRLFANFVERQSGVPFDATMVKSDDIRMWVLTLKNQGYGARNIARKISALRSFWRYLLKMGLVSDNPTTKIITPKFSKPLPTTFREQEVERALEYNDDADDYRQVFDSLVVDMLYQTGMRRAELLSLTLPRITLNGHGGELKVIGKRNKERIIPFGAELEQRILHYLTVRRDLGASSDGSFLVRANGEAATAYDIYRAVKQSMATSSTQTKLSPHVLRHTFASTLLNNGADINAVKALLGHANLNATQIYTHVTFEEKLKAYKQAHPHAGEE